MNEFIDCFYFKFDKFTEYDIYHNLKKIDIVHLLK
jgi:hypothetical protein